MTTLEIPPESLLEGPILIGTFFNWGLHGALCVQIYFYYLSSRNDPTPLKCFVYLLFLAEWIQTAFLSTATFIILIGAADASLTIYVATTLFESVIPILSALVAAMVQIFYAWRIWIITARKLPILALIIIFLALSQLTAAIIGSLHLTGSAPLASYVTPYSSGGSIAPIVIWLVGSVLVDVIIAISMSILLNRHKGVESESNILVTRLVKHVVGSGIATASVAVLALILWITDTFTLWLLADCPILVLSKLYACTALISLNNRDLVRRGEDEEETRIYRQRESERHSLISKLRDKLRRVYSGQPGLYIINPFAVDRGLETSLTERASHDVLIMESKMDPSVIDLTEA